LIVDIDGVPFDDAIEHFSFPLYHVIADMDELAKLRRFPRLTAASFFESGLDDRGLQHVAAVTTIDNLNLQSTPITNGGLACLVTMPLKHLRLKENAQLTDDCVPHLVRITSLVTLGVHETSIGQAGLDQLVALPNLRYLVVYIRDGNYTLESLRELSVRMPECEIVAKGHPVLRAGVWDH
jgi:hypothetical protein